MNRFENTVAAVIQSCPPGTVFLAAVSGGADSIAMLSALSAVMRGELRCKKRGKLGSLYCMHVEHGIRPAAESRGDAEFVLDSCKKLGIECRVESIPPGKISSFARRKGLGLEAAARFFRHRALFREVERLRQMPGNNVRILVAHTRDDMLETAIMRVLRGAGPEGLAAMPVNKGRILRPLLSMTRADVLEYLTNKNIPWREDSTNKDVNFLRNRIRHQLVPLLNESFPSWKSGLAAMAETQSLAAEFIRDEARSRVCWEWGLGNGERGMGKRRGSCTPQSLSTDADVFFAQSAIIREETLFHGIDFFPCGSVPKRSVIRRFCAGLVNTADLGSLRVWRKEGKIVLSSAGNSLSESGFTLLINQPGLYNLKKICIEVCPCASQGKPDGFYAVLPLVFRRSFKDDFLVSTGRKIGRRNLKKSLMSAVDRLGTAAFIGSKGFLIGRDLPLEAGDNRDFFLVSIRRSNNEIRGNDVQQSK